jgi:hypothetical protein
MGRHAVRTVQCTNYVPTNGILRDVLCKFVIVYLDDVYVYSRTRDEHLGHLRLVFQRFKEEGLKLHIEVL